MKRILIILITAVMLLTGCNCNSAEDSGTPQEPAPPPSSGTASNSPSSVSQSEMEPEPDTTRVEFTNGPNGSEKVALAVNDSFLGFTLEKLEVEYDNGDLWSLTANFTGRVTLSGRLRYEDIEGPHIVRFDPAEQSQSLLPYPVGTERAVWFGFTDGEAVKQMVGKEFFDMECEIVIDAFNINFAYADVWDEASIVEITPIH